MSGSGSRAHSRDASTAMDSFGRVEVLPCRGKRHRTWPDDVKAAILLETLKPGVTVADAARRHDIAVSLLHKWRRKARRRSLEGQTPTFTPVAITPPQPVLSAPAAQTSCFIEMESDGIRLSIPAHAGREAILAVMEGLGALKRRR